MASPCLACPAASLVHPVLSLNKDDVRCGIAGHMREARTSPCVDPSKYVRCSIWKLTKDMERQHMGGRLQSVRRDKPDTLRGVTRERA